MDDSSGAILYNIKGIILRERWYVICFIHCIEINLAENIKQRDFESETSDTNYQTFWHLHLERSVSIRKEVEMGRDRCFSPSTISM